MTETADARRSGCSVRTTRSRGQPVPQKQHDDCAEDQKDDRALGHPRRTDGESRPRPQTAPRDLGEDATCPRVSQPISPRRLRSPPAHDRRSRSHPRHLAGAERWPCWSAPTEPCLTSSGSVEGDWGPWVSPAASAKPWRLLPQGGRRCSRWASARWPTSTQRRCGTRPRPSPAPRAAIRSSRCHSLTSRAMQPPRCKRSSKASHWLGTRTTRCEATPRARRSDRSPSWCRRKKLPRQERARREAKRSRAPPRWLAIWPTLRTAI